MRFVEASHHIHSAFSWFVITRFQGSRHEEANLLHPDYERSGSIKLRMRLDCREKHLRDCVSPRALGTKKR
jgi:hypothetical protein